MPMFMPDPERDEDRWDEGVDYSRFPQQYPSTPEEVEELQRRLGEEWAERLGKDSLPKTPGAGKVEAAGIEPARHSLPNSSVCRTNSVRLPQVSRADEGDKRRPYMDVRRNQVAPDGRAVANAQEAN